MSTATATSNALASAVAAKIDKAYPFTVDKLPLFGPDRLTTPHYGLFRSDDGVCLPTTVKSGYEPHTKDDIAAICEASIVAFETAHQAKITARWTGRGHRVIIAPSNEYRRSIYGTKDSVFPRVIINAEFGRVFEAAFGLFRDLCSNLEMVDGVAQTSFRIRHTSSLRENMDELINDFGGLAAKAENVYEAAQKLEAQRASVSEFIAALYPVADGASRRETNSARKRAQSIVDRILDERQRSGRPSDSIETATVWELVQGVTGYVQHDKPRRGNPDMVSRALMGLDDKDTQAAWRLGFELAA